MNNYKRDIIILVNDAFVPADVIQRNAAAINKIIATVDNAAHFCRVHELVNRNRITSRKSRILQAVETGELRPFRFLLNKN